MSMQDPIADMLTRVRNGGAAGLKKIEMPNSREKAAIAAVLKEEGYISDFVVLEDGAKRVLSVTLKYHQGEPVISGIERVSKPSCRIHCTCREIPKVRGGMGNAILTTPNGIMSDRKARAANVGGEILLYVW